MSTPTHTAVEVAGLSKSYGPVQALRSVDLTVKSGGYFVLLGPSGGGKTTLLRLIGGFIRPSAGVIRLHGADVAGLGPDRRPTTMVFQSYALFPHMDVARNVGYGLRLKKLSKPEIAERVARMLALVGLEGYDERKPHELSGGQQQRVQLARSLVLDADILLLDEPLASLDAKLRKEMCLELKRIQEQVGITFIHVTHNQEEAMVIADRIALIADGELVEEGSARDVYEHPRRRFTAGFIGENNIMDGRVTAVGDDAVTVDLGHARVRVPRAAATVAEGAAVSLSIRSERCRLVPARDELPDGTQVISARLIDEVYQGLTTSLRARLDDGTEVTVRELANDTADSLSPGDEIQFAWRIGDARLHLD